VDRVPAQGARFSVPAGAVATQSVTASFAQPLQQRPAVPPVRCPASCAIPSARCTARSRAVAAAVRTPRSTTAESSATPGPRHRVHEYGTKATVAQATSRHSRNPKSPVRATETQVTRADEPGHSHQRRVSANNRSRYSVSLAVSAWGPYVTRPSAYPPDRRFCAALLARVSARIRAQISQFGTAQPRQAIAIPAQPRSPCRGSALFEEEIAQGHARGGIAEPFHQALS
jgi:hypothetical protein